MGSIDDGFEALSEGHGLVYPLPGIVLQQALDTASFVKNPNLVELEEVQLRLKKKVYRGKYFGKLDSIAKAQTTDYVCIV